MDRAAQARAFIADTTADPLGLAFRIAVLRGLRRGEICGLRWCDIDLDAGTISVEQTVLQLGGRVVTGGRPKTTGSKRVVYLDAATVALLRQHRQAWLKTRLKASTAWQDWDLVFCRDDGSPWPPD